MTTDGPPVDLGSTEVLGLATERETVYVCLACGKRSLDRYGRQAIDRSWDESCMLNAALCYVDALTFEAGRVVHVGAGGVISEEAKC